MRAMRLLSLLPAALLALPMFGCDLFESKPPPEPRYFLGTPYQAGGIWYYPRETYHGTETGLAAVAGDRHKPLTADGEAYDADAMAAGHQTMQLPAIARVTNLENGAQLLVRVNDRGPARPHRLLELTPRAARLLGVPASGGTQVRLEVLEVESRQAVEGLRGAPTLEIAAAPRGVVRTENLGGTSAPAPVQAEAAVVAGPGKPQRLPETISRTAPAPGMLYIRLGSFGRMEFADRQRARLAQLSPIVETEREGRLTVYRLRIGPLQSVAAADATLDQVIRAGITDARIVVGNDTRF